MKSNPLKANFSQMRIIANAPNQFIDSQKMGANGYSKQGRAKRLASMCINKLVNALTVCCIVAFCHTSVFAAGLLWSDDDLSVWRDRAINGPYLTAGDSFDPLVPAEWNGIVSDKNSFMSNPSAERVSVLSIPDSGVYSGSQDMVAAAFYALVKQDSSVANAVKSEILWHARASGTQVSPTQSIITDQGNWWKASWLLRFLMSADFIESSFTTSELAEVKAWLSNWARAYESSVHEELNNVWPNRYNRDYTTPGFATTSAGYTVYAYQDSSGVKRNQIPASARYYNNRRSTIMQVVGLISIWINDPTLMDRSKLYVEEWLQFSVFPDGSVGEYERNKLSGNIQQGMIYNAANLEACISIASAFSQIGDNSLFEYSTRNGRWGTESGSGEPDKNLKMAVYAHMDLIEHERNWYFDRGSVIDDHRIDSTSETGSNIGYQWVGEIYFAPMGNRYWKDERIKQGYMRTATNSVPYTSKFGTAGPLGGPWGGHQAAFPSMLFMFAEMEDVGTTTPTSGDGDPTGYREAMVGGQLVFGLDPAWASGSEFEKAFDGDASTFYDYGNSGVTFAGIDLGEAAVLQAIRYQPRTGQTDRMVGGIFEGSNESSVSGYETIYVISAEPSDSAQVVNLDSAPAYRYYRYLAPAGGYGNIAEFSLELAVVTSPEPEVVYPTGYREAMVGGQLVFGLDPAWASGSEFEKAFDGDASTFYDYGNSGVTFAGIDLGQSTVVTAIHYQPRAKFAKRMVGGTFEGSNESSVSGYETIHVIAAQPTYSDQIITVNSDKAYRYYRYLAPAKAYGNIAEFTLEFSPHEPVSDTDNLPDDWEIQYFGGINVVNGGETEDFDGDGSSNYDEWIAGTNPTDANDTLELSTVIGVAWMSKNSRSYEIEYSDDNWSTFTSSETLVGDGGELVWIDPDSLDVIGNRQYRIVVINN